MSETEMGTKYGDEYTGMDEAKRTTKTHLSSVYTELHFRLSKDVLTWQAGAFMRRPLRQPLSLGTQSTVVYSTSVQLWFRASANMYCYFKVWH